MSKHAPSELNNIALKNGLPMFCFGAGNPSADFDYALLLMMVGIGLLDAKEVSIPSGLRLISPQPEPLSKQPVQTQTDADVQGMADCFGA